VLQADQSAKYRMQLAQQAQQQQIALQQAQSDQRLFDQRAKTVESAIINFKKASEKVGSKQEYDALADAYGAALQQYGVRNMDGNWLRANVPYMKPSEAKTAEKAFANWMKNPTNAQLLKDNPQGAANSVVEVDLNADGVKERIPFRQLADKAGQGFAQGPDGQILAAPRGIAGTSAFDMLLNARYKKFTAENGKEPDPKQYEQMVQKAIIDSKDKPAPEEDASVTLTSAGLDAAALNYAKTGVLPPMGMSRGSAGIRSKIINRAAELYPNLDVAANKAGFGADQGALQQLTKQANAVEAFEKTAGANLDRFLDIAKDVADSGVPWVNKPYRTIRRSLMGDPKLAAFDAARLTAQNEIARVLNSANATGVISDRARKEMEQALSPDATFAQIVSAARLFKADMLTRREAYRAQIAELQQKVRQAPGQMPPEPTAAPDALTSAKDKLRRRGGSD
jgi:hypothetical protein